MALTGCINVHSHNILRLSFIFSEITANQHKTHRLEKVLADLLEDSSQPTGVTNKHQDDIKHLHTANTYHFLRHEELHEQVNKQEDEISSFHLVNANLSATYERVEGEVNSAVESINVLRTQIQQISSFNSGQSNSLSQVQEQVVELRRKYYELLSERNQMKSQLNSLEGKPKKFGG